MFESSDTPQGDPIQLVKWGGSLLTDKTRPETLRADDLKRLAAELARALPRLQGGLVLGHGSGSFGHVAAERWRIHEGLSSTDQLPGVTATQSKAALLHWRVMEELAEAGVPAFSIAPSSAVVAEAGRPMTFAAEPVALALAAGMVPVVYGDVVLDRRQGTAICSTETVFEALSEALPAHGYAITRCLWLGETEGVYDTAGRTLPLLTPSCSGLDSLGGARGTDVTGGMAHRVRHALALARRGIPSWIGSGRVPGRFERALLADGTGEEVPGTRVTAQGPAAPRRPC